MSLQDLKDQVLCGYFSVQKPLESSLEAQLKRLSTTCSYFLEAEMYFSHQSLLNHVCFIENKPPVSHEAILGFLTLFFFP